MQGVLLAAGKGTRLQPLTLARSKAMAPIAGRPMGARVADLLVAQEIEELIVVVGPSDHEIQPYFRREAKIDIPMRFVVQEDRMGSAHALSMAAPFLRGDFIMSACDNLVPMEHVREMVATHRARHAAVTLSLMPIDISQASKTGIVVWDDPHVRHIVEKPKPEDAPSNISSLPLYVFGPEMLEMLPLIQPSARGEYEVQDGIQRLIQETGRVFGVLTTVRQQVTTAADLLALNAQFLDSDGSHIHSTTVLPPDVTLLPPVIIEADVVLGPGCTLGPRVLVERGAHIGAGATVSETLVLRGAEIAAGQQVSNEVVAPLSAYAPAVAQTCAR